MARTEWTKTNIPKHMLTVIDRYLDSDFARERGLTSRTDVILGALRMLFERDGFYPHRPRFEPMDVTNERVRIVDNALQRITTVRLRSRYLLCELCNARECIHIDFALSLPDVHRLLPTRSRVSRGW